MVERSNAVVWRAGRPTGGRPPTEVMRFSRERGQGFPTSAGPGADVVAAALFDLPVATGAGAGGRVGSSGRAAARGRACVSGRIGDGRGATVGSGGSGVRRARRVGNGGGPRRFDATVGALVACNPAGDVIGPDGRLLAGSSAPPDGPSFPAPTPFEHTTLVVVATDARVTKAECHLLAQSAHDGLARAIRPAHTRYDGDFAAVLATGEVDAHPDRLRVAATEAVSLKRYAPQSVFRLTPPTAGWGNFPVTFPDCPASDARVVDAIEGRHP